MIIAPLKPEQITSIVEQAFNDLHCDEKRTYYAKLSAEKKANLHQLCWFLSFYISEALGENIKPELDEMISALRGVAAIPDLNDLDRIPILEALLSLKNLKGGGLVPGSRIPISNHQQFLYRGSPCMCREEPNTLWKIRNWTSDLSTLLIVCDDRSKQVALDDVIFITNEKVLDTEPV